MLSSQSVLMPVGMHEDCPSGERGPNGNNDKFGKSCDWYITDSVRKLMDFLRGFGAYNIAIGGDNIAPYPWCQLYLPRESCPSQNRRPEKIFHGCIWIVFEFLIQSTRHHNVSLVVYCFKHLGNVARVYGRVFPFPGVTLKMVFYNLRADSDDQSDNNTYYYANAFDDNNDKTCCQSKSGKQSHRRCCQWSGTPPFGKQCSWYCWW